MKGEIQTLSTDGRTSGTLISGLTSMPDAVQIDTRPGKGHIYWTNMGTFSSENNGFISRANLADGSNITTIVPVGVTRTPKQLVLDTEGEKLYWCDREGCRIMRCNLDGSNVETLYASTTPASDDVEQRKNPRKWCVGLVLDKSRGLMYWTQKGANKGWCGSILRAPIELPPGSQPHSRHDVEALFSGMPEPIHLEFNAGFLYWTDRGDPPFGNTLNRAEVGWALDAKRAPRGPGKEWVIAERYHEAMGLTIDRAGGKIYVCDLSGTVWVTELDGSNKRALQREVGTFTGVTFHPGA
ncbi:hypothetical protein FB45DRAFT_739582 [Roridomyces roridus]|uniref:YWTD domain-containing protein n=1 Tax=Roridomyces roridus TaxID=1738132 RepID=A0AAD7FQZ8_9AGAR|nr:hypothetical protein FB45DRAFT_739582 [Roridomyces roridus]